VFDWVDRKLSKWESVLGSCEKNEHGFVEREWGEGRGGRGGPKLQCMDLP